MGMGLEWNGMEREENEKKIKNIYIFSVSWFIYIYISIIPQFQSLYDV